MLSWHHTIFDGPAHADALITYRTDGSPDAAAHCDALLVAHCLTDG